MWKPRRKTVFASTGDGILLVFHPAFRQLIRRLITVSGSVIDKRREASYTTEMCLLFLLIALHGVIAEA